MYFTDYNSSTVNNSNYKTGDHGLNRSQVDALCQTASMWVIKTKGQCNNVRALMSFTADDEIRDMVSNYSVPESAKIYNYANQLVADNFFTFSFR